jgi:hypothetical protein
VTRFPALAGLLAGLLCAAIARGDTDDHSPRIAVVVGRASFVKEISRDTLRDVYLRRQRVWSDGTRAIPINLPAGNPLRERFSAFVLGRSTQELVSYWNARYFEGITPPAVLSSPAAIRAYLNAEPGAIAYLPATEVDESCRSVLSLE